MYRPVGFPRQEPCKPVIVDPVGDGPAGCGIRTDLDLGETCPGKKAGHHGGPAVGSGGEHVEKPDPEILEGRQDPVCPDDLLLTLSGIDPVFREKKGDMIHGAPESREHACITGRDRMIDIRFRDVCTHHLQKRQEHGPDRMEIVRKSRVGVFFPADLREDVHEIFTGQELLGRDAPLLKNIEQFLPIRAAAFDQFKKRAQFDPVKLQGPGAAPALLCGNCTRK